MFLTFRNLLLLRHNCSAAVHTWQLTTSPPECVTLTVLQVPTVSHTASDLEYSSATFPSTTLATAKKSGCDRQRCRALRGALPVFSSLISNFLTSPCSSTCTATLSHYCTAHSVTAAQHTQSLLYSMRSNGSCTVHCASTLGDSSISTFSRGIGAAISTLRGL